MPYRVHRSGFLRQRRKAVFERQVVDGRQCTLLVDRHVDNVRRPDVLGRCRLHGQ